MTGRVLGFISIVEAASKFNVGISTVKVCVELGKLDKEGGNDGKESCKCTNNMLSNNVNDGIGYKTTSLSSIYRR